MIILAVDPGLFSGYAVWESDKPWTHIFSAELAYSDLGKTVKGKLSDLIYHGDVHIAVERYTMTGGVKTAQPEALKVTGQLELLADIYGRKIHFYLPSTTKKIVSAARLRTAGWYRSTKDGHANDAARVVGTHLGQHHPEIFGSLFGI